jgi:hypothetical protein
MTSNIGIFGYLGSRDWAGGLLDTALGGSKGAGSTSVFLSFLPIHLLLLFVHRQGRFIRHFQNFLSATHISIFGRHLRRAGVWFGLASERKDSLGGLDIRVYPFFFLAILPWLLLQHCSKTTIVAPCFDQEIARKKHGR